MPVKMREIAAYMDKLAPERLAESWDNVGILVGDEDADINNVLVALDVIDDVVTEAIDLKADCIITHHPLIFSKLGRITTGTPLGKRLIKLIKNDIAVYSAHTNLDMAECGTNAVLAKLLGLTDIEFLCDSKEDFALGRAGNLKTPITLIELAEEVKSLLKLEHISYMGESERILKRAGVMTGSGGEYEYLRAAIKKKCDVLITGDVKYHSAQAALERGLMMIDATHYAGEAFYMKELCGLLKSGFGELKVNLSNIDGQVIKYV